jgi:hypothetical protein
MSRFYVRWTAPEYEPDARELPRAFFSEAHGYTLTDQAEIDALGWNQTAKFYCHTVTRVDGRGSDFS